MATQSKTAQWDVTVDDGTSFVVSANGKSKAESMASEHLAEVGKPAAKFQIANSGTGSAPEGIVAPVPADTLADDLLAGMDDTAPAASARQAKPDPKPAGKGKPGRKQNSAAVRARKAAEATKAAKASDEKATEPVEAPKPAKAKATGKRGPTISEQLDALADEAAEVWNTMQFPAGTNARLARGLTKQELENRHPALKKSLVLNGRIPNLLNRRGIDARQLPPNVAAAEQAAS